MEKDLDCHQSNRAELKEFEEMNSHEAKSL